MRKIIKRTAKKGLPPGTIIPVGSDPSQPVKITVIDYDKSMFQERQITAVEECFSFRDTNTVTWINVDGTHDVSVLEKLGQHFGFHSLALEDIANTAQRPKVEDYDDYLFFVLKMIYCQENRKEAVIEHFCLILGARYVISFQQQGGDIFDVIRDRIRKDKGRVRKMGPDYLAYALMDTMVDNYFLVVESFGELLEELEIKIMADPHPETLQEIHSLKNEMIYVRKTILPMRELVSIMQGARSTLVKQTTGIYLRDLHDHVIQILDTLETFRDLLVGLHDSYLSNMSYKMNEIMKVLTIISTVFMPLSFIVGLYGMNFNTASHWNMPELNWRYGYLFVWGIMIITVAALFYYFKKKKWF